MTLLVGILSIGDGRIRSPYMAAKPSVLEADGQAADRRGSTVNRVSEASPLFDLDVPLETARWEGIVIHHLGRPAGDVGTVNSMFVANGIEDGIGYHFLIGNGNGLEDGIVAITERWQNQDPGFHVLGDPNDWPNQHAIGICLVGNGNRRPFTEAQIEGLAYLVRQLQSAFEISAADVRRHSDLAEGVASPGDAFPMDRLMDAIHR